MSARPDTDVQIATEGGNRNYEVSDKLVSLLMFACFVNKAAYCLLPRILMSVAGVHKPGGQAKQFFFNVANNICGPTVFHVCDACNFFGDS
jgi:hypothetical protein